MALKPLFGEGKVLSSFCYIWDVWARHSAKGEAFSPTQPSFHSGIRLVTGNVVMVVIDIEKAPCGSGYTRLRERMQFYLYVCF